MASNAMPKEKHQPSTGDSKKQKGQREMRSIRVETVHCSLANSPAGTTPCSSKEQTPQPTGQF